MNGRDRCYDYFRPLSVLSKVLRQNSKILRRHAQMQRGRKCGCTALPNVRLYISRRSSGVLKNSEKSEMTAQHENFSTEARDERWGVGCTVPNMIRLPLLRTKYETCTSRPRTGTTPQTRPGRVPKNSFWFQFCILKPAHRQSSPRTSPWCWKIPFDSDSAVVTETNPACEIPGGILIQPKQISPAHLRIASTFSACSISF
jgi:hypothetical protein